MPRNWLRPRFDYRPTRDENLFEVTAPCPGFAHSLRAYTRDRSYTFDKDLWARLAPRSTTHLSACPSGRSAFRAPGPLETPASAAAHTSFVIAPVDAPGKIVYWALANGLGSLKGFGIGEEGVGECARSLAGRRARSGEGDLHRLPRGDARRNAVGFALGQGLYLDSIADIRTDSVGKVPPYVTPTALRAPQLEGLPTYSPAHWSAGDRIAVVGDTGDLTWISSTAIDRDRLPAPATPRLATAPTFRHDGPGSSTCRRTRSPSGGRRPARATSTSPVRGGAGGAASPSPAPPTPTTPSTTPLLAGRRVHRVHAHRGSGIVYSVPEAEVFVVPSAGGVATRVEGERRASLPDRSAQAGAHE
jgi:hypothetical protein